MIFSVFFVEFWALTVSLDHLSPEICKGQPYDASSDIWALGTNFGAKPIFLMTACRSMVRICHPLNFDPVVWTHHTINTRNRRSSPCIIPVVVVEIYASTLSVLYSTDTYKYKCAIVYSICRNDYHTSLPKMLKSSLL